MSWQNVPNYGFGAPKQNTQWAPLNPLGGSGGGGGSQQVRVVDGQLQPVGQQQTAGGTLRDRIFGEYQKQLNTYNQGAQNDQKSIESLLGGRGVNMPSQQSQSTGPRDYKANPLTQAEYAQRQMQSGIKNNGGIPMGIQNVDGFSGNPAIQQARQGMASSQGGYGITQNQYGGGNLPADHPWYSAQASPIMANLVRNGLAGTTFGQNQIVLSNSLALADKSMQDQRLQMDAQQQAYSQAADQQRFDQSQNQYALNRGDNLARDAIDYYKQRNSIPPDIGPLLQMAQIEGQGATDGMVQPQVGGWGGSGGFVGGYDVPNQAWGGQGAYYQPQQQQQQYALGSDKAKDTAKRIRDKQREYEASLRRTPTQRAQSQIQPAINSASNLYDSVSGSFRNTFGF